MEASVYTYCYQALSPNRYIQKNPRELREMSKKSQTLHLRNYSFLTVQDLCRAHYKILSIIFVKEFIKLNAKTLIHVVLSIQTLKMI